MSSTATTSASLMHLVVVSFLGGGHDILLKQYVLKPLPKIYIYISEIQALKTDCTV